MEYSEEIHELDQSPHAYTVVPGTISEENKALIEDIRKRYGYNGDLFHLITTLPSWVNTFKDLKRQRGRPKKHQELYGETMKAAEKLQEYMGYFSGNMRGEMRDKTKTENQFAAFSAIEKHLPFLINQCRYKAQNTPKDVGGQQSGSIPKSLISLLIQQYEHNTGKKATCGWVESHDKFSGKFYEFMTELKTIIEDMGISLGEEKTIGQNIRKLLTMRKKQGKSNPHQQFTSQTSNGLITALTSPLRKTNRYGTCMTRDRVPLL